MCFINNIVMAWMWSAPPRNVLEHLALSWWTDQTSDGPREAGPADRIGPLGQALDVIPVGTLLSVCDCVVGALASRSSLVNSTTPAWPWWTVPTELSPDKPFYPWGHSNSDEKGDRPKHRVQTFFNTNVRIHVLRRKMAILGKIIETLGFILST